MTYSILAVKRATGELGIAVQSKFPGAGALVAHGRAGTAVIGTQAYSSARLADIGMIVIEAGADAEEALAIMLRADTNRDERQIAIVTQRGESATFLGDAVKTWDGWAGHRAISDAVAHGNSLVGPEVLDAAIAAYETSSGDLAESLIEALTAAQAAGGEIRGQQSAAVLVVQNGAGFEGYSGVKVDISVYDHPTPIEELNRCYKLHALSYYPSEERNLIKITPQIGETIIEILKNRGFIAQDVARWSDELIPRLKRFMGNENYDNRLRDDDKIDTEVLEDMLKKHREAVS